MIRLKTLINEASKPKVIDATYIERSGKLYSIKVDGKKVNDKYMDDEFSVKIPSRYNPMELDKIIKQFKKTGIKFTYDDSMDIS